MSWTFLPLFNPLIICFECHFIMSPPLSDRDIYSVIHVCNSEIKLLRPLFFAMLLVIDLIFGMCVYNDKLQIKFTFRCGPMIFGRVLDFEIWPNI